MDQLIVLLEEVVRSDLEECGAAIRSADQTTALASLERAFSKLDGALDLARTERGSALDR